MSGKLSGTGHIHLRRRPILRVERFDDAFERKYARSTYVRFVGAGTDRPDGTGYHALIGYDKDSAFRLNPGCYLITYPNGEQLPVAPWVVETFFYPSTVKKGRTP